MLVASADVDKEAADISAQVDRDRAARVSIWAALGSPELRAQLHIGEQHEALPLFSHGRHSGDPPTLRRSAQERVVQDAEL